MESRAFPEALKGYDGWIDGVYIQRFGTPSPIDEAFNTSQEYKERLYGKYDQTINDSSEPHNLEMEGGENSENSSYISQGEDNAPAKEPNLVKLEMQHGATSDRDSVAPIRHDRKQEPNIVDDSEPIVIANNPSCCYSDCLGDLPKGPVDDSESRREPLLGGPAADTTSTWEDITVCQLRSSSMLRVPVILQGKEIKAVVDTAAEVTFISDTVFRELEPKPPCLKRVTRHTAGRDMKMEGFVVGPVALKMGNSTFHEAVYVALSKMTCY